MNWEQTAGRRAVRPLAVARGRALLAAGRWYEPEALAAAIVRETIDALAVMSGPGIPTRRAPAPARRPGSYTRA
jgi:hypothetical protein